MSYLKTQDFVVEYSDDNGASWTNIATVPADERLLSWSVPTDFTGEGIIRVTSGAFSDESDNNFDIANFPTVMSLQRVCEGEATISWTAVDGAESYDVYLLGEKYMEVVTNTTDLEATFDVEEDTSGNYNFWYSVAAKNDTADWISRRRNAVNYTGGQVDCTLGIDSTELANAITMYPNPADDQVRVDFGSTSFDAVNLTVTNSLGQTIQRVQNVSSNEATINVSNFNTGIYFVTINADGQQTTKKLVVR